MPVYLQAVTLEHVGRPPVVIKIAVRRPHLRAVRIAVAEPQSAQPARWLARSNVAPKFVLAKEEQRLAVGIGIASPLLAPYEGVDEQLGMHDGLERARLCEVADS